MSGAPAKRQAVRELIAAGLSQTRACAALATSRSSLAYVPRARHEEALVAAIKAACKRKPRWGYKRVHAQLRREGHPVNRKRVLRLWRELGFTLPARRPRKRLRSGESVPGKAEHANHVWTYDFIFDATAGGRMLKVLTVVDEYTRQALAATAGRSLTAAGVRKEPWAPVLPPRPAGGAALATTGRSSSPSSSPRGSRRSAPPPSTSNLASPGRTATASRSTLVCVTSASTWRSSGACLMFAR